MWHVEPSSYGGLVNAYIGIYRVADDGTGRVGCKLVCEDWILSLDACLTCALNFQALNVTFTYLK